jgi:hypothetical protein
MKCPRCQHENEVGAKFCEECAAPLARSCSNCGRQVSPTAKFCPECARPNGAGSRKSDRGPLCLSRVLHPQAPRAKILTSKAALEGERKQVTVLFADSRAPWSCSPTAIPKRRARSSIPCSTLMMEAVHRYEGTVNQVMGDGIMALFGAPLAHEDHAVRACYAALGCRTPCGATRMSCAARRAWRCRSASASTPETSWCARSAAISAWTTPPWARPRTWRRAWSSSRPRQHPAHRRDAAPG